MASKTTKYLQRNLTREVKDLYNENYKTLLKELENTTNGKTSHVHESKELILLQWPYSPKPPPFNTIPIKIPMEFFTEIT